MLFRRLRLGSLTLVARCEPRILSGGAAGREGPADRESAVAKTEMGWRVSWTPLELLALIQRENSVVVRGTEDWLRLRSLNQREVPPAVMPRSITTESWGCGAWRRASLADPERFELPPPRFVVCFWHSSAASVSAPPHSRPQDKILTCIDISHSVVPWRSSTLMTLATHFPRLTPD